MRPSHYAQLLAIARRATRRADEADDLVQDALLEAVRTGRMIAGPQDMRWLAGIIRNRAKLAARGAGRARLRETHWHALRPEPAPAAETLDLSAVLSGLPPSLKAVAALTLAGHNRREIAYLLDLSDAALRQRIAALKRQLKGAGIAMPEGMPGLNLDLAYGRIRDALLPGLLRQGGIFASHDPDGHLFIVRRSQKP
ncbi:ECF subfamily RNA polymerase sigma-24 factor [Devosia yakushimensis]|uniref:ECF subfamily RNA polymerase sigma-24 factor n=1 Tax=Devosia yakushimensis TaxID=470028 RepID=A0ABQ5UKL9_9HYPH|nr:sigma factor [Devosia yakushimensis]GLQ12178.1 ECF subfamily RNA polymerase sigma-24 factor [Devosia yakushimensis]